MTEQFEQDVARAIEIFIADIKKAAQRTAIAGIRSAFVRVSSQAGDAVAAGANMQPAGKPAHRRASAPTDPTAVLARVVTFIRAHPGLGTVQLGQSLGLRTDMLRRYLCKLADDGTIRIEEVALGGLRRRTYFAVEHVNGQRADGATVPAEASA